MEWMKKRKMKDGYFYPIAFIDRVEEPEFGCEGRPDGVTVKGKVILQSKMGQVSIMVEEKLLWKSGLDDAMWIGYLIEEDNRVKWVMVRDKKEEIREVEKAIIDLFQKNGVIFTYE